MIKAIIFDFFDVFRTDAYKTWLKTNNLKLEGEYYEASRQMDLGNITSKEFLERLSRLSGRTITHEEIDSTAKVDEAVVEIAQGLKADYRIALLSNAPSAFIRELLAVHDLERPFHEIVISSEVGMVKPSAEIFEHTLSKLGVQANEAIFIDDNPKHVAAAAKIGIHGVQFFSATQLKGELARLGVDAAH
jgi:HAD superfamily hydrolase (TIGR01509 family)